ncbi:unnamed protein product, partial [Dicrocoelium dendriticum]
KEKSAVDLIFHSAIDSLSDEDKKLPQVQIILPVLRRGVGIHHGGLLPILKEIVEILFSEGLIKVLFATETFAMGLNMPARTVLFTSTRKFDGQTFRILSSGEYIQMSGRAGRRGKDDRGTVILMLDNRISPSEARQLLLGEPDRLDSSFYLTNNMVLNLLRVEDVNPEILLEKCFYQFQNRSKLPSLDKRIRTLEDEARGIQLPPDVDLDQLGSCVKLREALAAAERERWSLVMKAKCVISFLQPGRVVRVRTLDDVDYGWGVVVNINSARTRDSGKSTESNEVSTIMVECLLQVSSMSLLCGTAGDGSSKNARSIPLSMVEPINPDFELPEDDDESTRANAVRLISVPISCLAELSSVCLTVSSIIGSHLGKAAVIARRLAAQPDSVLRHLWEGIGRARDKLGGSIPLLDPVKDMQIRDKRLTKCKEMIHMLEARLALNPLTKRLDIDQLVDLYTRRSS